MGCDGTAVLRRRSFVAVLIALLACCGVLVPPSRGWTQDALRIAAIVNDDVISVHDLGLRVGFLIATSNLADTPENRARISPVALRALIEDKLKLQEAKRLNIQVTRQEVDAGVARLEAQFGLRPNQLQAALAERGAKIQAVRDQVRAEIAWVKAVRREAQGQVTISDEEVSARLDRMREEAGKPEFRVAEIFLAVDDASREADVRSLAERLLQELKRGASFPALARSFSQSPSAAGGGDLGWEQIESFDPAIRQALVDLGPGDAYGPVRTQTGYQIVLLIERRVAPALTDASVRVVLHRLALPLPADAPDTLVRQRLEEAKALAARARTCDELSAIARDAGSPLPAELGTVDLRQLNPTLQAAVTPLRSGGKTAPFRSPDGAVVLMVCDRIEGSSDQGLRDSARELLENERLTAISRRMLRDLMRQAFVDIRM